MMFERVDELLEKLPNPAQDEMGWSELRDQHTRNAHRLRAEAFKCVIMAAGNGILALGRPIAEACNRNRHSWSGVVTRDHRDPKVSVQG